MMGSRTGGKTLALAVLGGILVIGAATPAPASAVITAVNRSQQAPTYAVELVSTAATGVAMNDAGDVTGTSYPDPGCGSDCLPALETVVWRAGSRIVLPSIPGLSGITVRSINDQGWVAGFAGFPGTVTRAVVWKPNGNTFEAIDLGVLPGTTISDAVGIDDLGRVVGWSTTQYFPPTGSPFMWSEATGMVDLAALGYPDEPPLAINPGGTVATQFSWYRLDDPSSVESMPSPPQGFGLGAEPTAINDAGDQARFLISTGPENLRYLFRFHHEGTWQQVSATGTGHLTTYGVGSITDAQDITATVASSGVIAFGPDGMAESLSPLLSPTYGPSDITFGGPINDRGEVLAQVMIGRTPRLVRMVPVEACGINCTRVSDLQMRGKFIDDPDDPGQCTPDASNLVVARLIVTDELGNRLPRIRITGHFLDDYWLDHAVTGTTNRQGTLKFVHQGPACVGAVAFLVTDAVGTGRVFDRTTGTLTNYVIPLP